MATNSLEKALEKQRQEAQKHARDVEKHARDAAQRAREDAVRTTAGQIVAGRPMIGSMLIMDKSSEEILRILLDLAKGDYSKELRGNHSVFPSVYQGSMSVEFEKLVRYGMIRGLSNWAVMWELYITPEGATYFEDKERAIEEDKKKSQVAGLSIGSIVAHGSQFFFGDVNDSTLSIDNRISQIEQLIDEKGGEDAAELKALLAEVQELLENMKDSRFIPKNTSLFTRLSNHFAKHGWFYGSMVTLFGTYAMQLIQG